MRINNNDFCQKIRCCVVVDLLCSRSETFSQREAYWYAYLKKIVSCHGTCVHGFIFNTYMNMVGGACLRLVGVVVSFPAIYTTVLAVEGQDMIRPACWTLHAHGDA